MTAIAPNSANLYYSPYNWLVTAGSAKTINAGAYMKMSLRGSPTDLVATFDMTNAVTPPTRVGFRVDGGNWQDYNVAASLPIALPTNNTWGVHTIEMVMISSTETNVRWNAPQNTALVFTGLSSAATTISADPVRKRPLRLLTIGDSITEGVLTLRSTHADGDSGRNDARCAWGRPLAEALGAEYGNVGFGSLGIQKGGAGGVPQFSLSVPYLWNGQARDLATEVPDVVVCHIGTNDGGGTALAVANGTRDLCNYLIGATPATTKILVLPGWRQTQMQAIKDGIAAASAPSRITFVDTTGWWSTADAPDSLHPYGYININQLGPRVAETVRPLLSGANNFFVKRGGLPVAVKSMTKGVS